MEKIHLICKECKTNYVLGENAIVATDLGVLSDCKGAIIGGDGTSFIENKDNPDLIDSLGKPWSSLSPRAVRSQQDEIVRISSLISTEGRRWWKCKKCDAVQIYKPLKKKKKVIKTKKGKPPTENRIEFMIKEYSNEIGDINDSLSGIYQGGHIPTRKLKNALSNIAPGIRENEIHLLVDTTFWESGKKGIIFTIDRLFWCEDTVKGGMIKYSRIKEVCVKDEYLEIDGKRTSYLLQESHKGIIQDLLNLIIDLYTNEEEKKVKTKKIRSFTGNEIESHIKEYSNEIESVNDYISSIYQGGHIPKRKLKNALSNISPGIQENEMVLLVDNTLWGSGKKGFVFTGDRLFWCEDREKRGMIKYSRIEEVCIKHYYLKINGKRTCLLLNEKYRGRIRDLLRYIMGLYTHEEEKKGVKLFYDEQIAKARKSAEPRPPITQMEDLNKISAELERIAEEGDVKGLIEVLKEMSQIIDEQNTKLKKKADSFRAHNNIQLTPMELMMLKAAGEAKSIRAKAGAILFSMGEPAVEPIIQALKDEVRTGTKHSNVSVMAMFLKTMGDKRAVQPLIKTLRDEDPDVRRVAAEALGPLGDKRGVKPLINALKDENQDVRENAAEALGWIGDTTAVKPLIQALKDDDEKVREAARKALEKINAKKEPK